MQYSKFVVVLLSKMFLYFVCMLSATLLEVTIAYDKNCIITKVPEQKPLQKVAQTPNTHEQIWIKPGEFFKKIVIRIVTDKPYALTYNKVHEKYLAIGFPYLKINHWNKIDVRIVRENKAFYPDLYVLKASVSGRVFAIPTKLYWRIDTLKRIEVLVEGGAKITIDCIPEEAIYGGQPGPSDGVVDHFFSDRTTLIYILAALGSILISSIVFFVAFLIIRRVKIQPAKAVPSRPQDLPKLEPVEENYYSQLKKRLSLTADDKGYINTTDTIYETIALDSPTKFEDDYVPMYSKSYAKP